MPSRPTDRARFPAARLVDRTARTGVESAAARAPYARSMGRPTLLIFTLGPEEERARRPLLSGANPRRMAPAAALEVELRRRCLEAAIEAGDAAGCEVEVAAPRRLDLPARVRHRPQVGRGFGERLRGALEAALEAAGGPVVVVGTDVPGLGADHVRRAVELLDETPHAAVVGPSPDGGFFLLATRRPLAAPLAQVRWCGRDARRTLVAALAAAGIPVRFLPPLADLDRPADLERFLAVASIARRLHSGWRRLIGHLERLLAAARRPLSDAAFAAPHLSRHLLPAGRAPPA